MSSAPEGTGPNLISDEELQKISIGERTPHNAPIALVEYDPSWPRLFAREAERIRVVLGDTARCIEHVGSTSVPGLAAKPIIDILLIVANSADEPSYVPQLEAAGYVLRIREPGGSNTASSRARTPTSTCMCSVSAQPSSTECCASATGCGPPTPIATTTRVSNVIWPGVRGSTCSTTPTPRLPWCRRSPSGRTQPI